MCGKVRNGEIVLQSSVAAEKRDEWPCEWETEGREENHASTLAHGELTLHRLGIRDVALYSRPQCCEFHWDDEVSSLSQSLRFESVACLRCV